MTHAAEPITVAIYLVDRSYGGPEEGGWFYTSGDPVAEYSNRTREFSAGDEDKACAYAKHLNESLCAKLNEGRPPISSMASRGRFEARVEDGEPAHFPKERPYYE